MNARAARRNVHPLDRRPQPVGGARDERRVERARDAQADRAARALALRLDARLVDRGRLARDDELARAVVVRRPHVRDLPAERLDDLVGEAEDRRHRAGVLLRGLRHREPALAHERDRVARPRATAPSRAPRTRRPSGRRRSRAGSRARAAPRRARATSRRAPAAAPRCRRGPRPAASKQSSFRSRPEASLALVVDGHRLGHGLGDVAAHAGLEASPGPGT